MNSHLAVTIWIGSLLWFPPTLVGQEKAKGVDQSAPSFAQMSLEQLLQVDVVSASKFPQKAAQAPSSVTVITADEIRKYGYRNLGEILRNVRSFYITSDRNYTYLGVRGFGRAGDYNTRVLLLLNGHRLNDPVYDQAFVGLAFPVAISAIDRVEIIRGPSSSLYGTNAFFAVIDVITKTGQALNGIQVSAEKSSFGSLRGGFEGGIRMSNGLDVALFGNIYDSKGQNLYFPEYDSPSTHHGLSENCDYESAQKLVARVSFKNYTLQAGFSSRKKGVPTGAFDTVFGDTRNATTDTIGFVGLSYDRNLSASTRLTGKVFYDRDSYDGAYVYNVSLNATPSTIVETDLARGARWGAELKVDRQILSRHFVSFGADFRDDFHQEQQTYDALGVYLNDVRGTRSEAAYLQDQFRVHQKLTVNMGLRYDHYQTFGGTTNPRLAAIYNPYPKTTFKFLYGQAFRAPNAYELYYADNITQKANPFLKPEKIRTTELVAEQQIGKNLQVTISGYRNNIRNLISQQVDGVDGLLVYENVDEVRATGMEIELSGKWDNGVMGRASYSLQDADSRSTGDLANSPYHAVKLNVSAPLVRKKLFAAFESSWLSKRLAFRDATAGSFWLCDLIISSQNLLKGFDVSLGIYNLFDRRYGDPASGEHREDVIQQDGRTVRFGISYRYGFGK
jgi:iron complex outermembrane receptor protein